MSSSLIKKFIRSLIRILLLLSIVLGIPTIIYCFWSSGKQINDGRHDLRRNGMWLQHGWLATDDWLSRNSKDFSHFRSSESIETLSERLNTYGIKYVFPHACPCSHTGNISPVNHAQLEKFLNHIGTETKVIPWVGGVLHEHCTLSDSNWRETFIKSIKNLLDNHPRLAGIQVNIEPLDSGDTDFLLLLDELRVEIGESKMISIAAYPPPTRWQPGIDVHWEEDFYREVSKRVDQVAPMMYDTAIVLEKPYIKLMVQWTKEVLAWSGDTEVLLGIPAYEDQGVGYHRPEVEHIESALKGIHTALSSYEKLPTNYAGIAIYSEWTMNDAKWKQVKTSFSK